MDVTDISRDPFAFLDVAHDLAARMVPGENPSYACSNPLCGTHASSGDACSSCGHPMRPLR